MHRNPLLEWGASRSPITHVDELNRRGVPIYLSPNLQDEMFRPNSVMRLYEKLETPKLMDITRGIHASSEGAGLVGFPNEVWDNVHAWMDYWLKGIENGVMDRSPVTIDIKASDDRVEFQDWPTYEVSDETYYLGKRKFGLFTTGSLGFDIPSVGSNEIDSGMFSGAHTGVPVISAALEAHTPIQITAWIPGINRNTAIVYQTESFSRSRLIAGIPTLGMWIVPSRPQVQVIAHLYDVDALGIGTLMTHGPVTLHDATPGEPVNLSFECVVTAYDVQAGHMLALVFDTYDINYGQPTDESFSVEFLYGKAHPSTLTIPYVN